MAYDLLIKNGRVVDPASKTDAALDVLLDGEFIKEVGAPGKFSSASNNLETLDASGLIVAPGFIDLHVHLREPGQEASETIETGTKSAARGGFTAVCCMPNTRPVHDNDQEIVFTVKLPAGEKTVMQSWFYDAEGKEIAGAYFAYVRRVR